jgi:hypothetical protein
LIRRRRIIVPEGAVLPAKERTSFLKRPGPSRNSLPLLWSKKMW